ncbi:hypothetical protein A9Q96_00185 [Rhodobacterales bacterium 52_120_T64]|nr:hypothetical protein A9Q96_00185 [Rhodobacterales bacterium 52_120_T64]
MGQLIGADHIFEIPVLMQIQAINARAKTCWNLNKSIQRDFLMKMAKFASPCACLHYRTEEKLLAV